MALRKSIPHRKESKGYDQWHSGKSHSQMAKILPQNAKNEADNSEAYADPCKVCAKRCEEAERNEHQCFVSRMNEPEPWWTYLVIKGRNLASS